MILGVLFIYHMHFVFFRNINYDLIINPCRLQSRVWLDHTLMKIMNARSVPQIITRTWIYRFRVFPAKLNLDQDFTPQALVHLSVKASFQ